jgi:hypothetical protein
LTRQGLVNAVNKFGSKWSGPGLIPFRYSTKDHGGYDGAEMGKVVNGKIVLFGGPLVTQPTAGSPIKRYKGKQPAPPKKGIPST